MRAGHNSGEVDASALRSYVERVERLQEEIDALSSDKSSIFKEAKGAGFDTRILKKVIARRRMDPDKRHEEEAIFDLYVSALGEA